MVDRAVAYAKASDVGFDPETFPTEPDTGLPQSFSPVGYQLYAWPEIICAHVPCQPGRGRDLYLGCRAFERLPRRGDALVKSEYDQSTGKFTDRRPPVDSIAPDVI